MYNKYTVNIYQISEEIGKCDSKLNNKINHQENKHRDDVLELAALISWFVLINEDSVRNPNIMNRKEISVEKW